MPEPGSARQVSWWRFQCRCGVGSGRGAWGGLVWPPVGDLDLIGDELSTTAAIVAYDTAVALAESNEIP